MLENVSCVLENWQETLWARGDKQRRINWFRIERRQDSIGSKNRTKTLMLNWDSSVPTTGLRSAPYGSTISCWEAASTSASARRLRPVLVLPAVDAVGSEIAVPEIP